MSKPWRFICPACDREFASIVAVRNHAHSVVEHDEGTTPRGWRHFVIRQLSDIALENAAFGEGGGPGKITWPVGSPQYDALAPMREFDRVERWRAADWDENQGAEI